MRSVKRAGDVHPLRGNGANSYHSATVEINLPILICLLGNFHLLKMGQPVKVSRGQGCDPAFS